MRHEVIYAVTCECGDKKLTWGINDGDIVVRNDIETLKCDICQEKYKLIDYKVKVL